ncbi:MAG: response regulator [Segetibacter sp.]|nr:response regulator [Segetibacter sp.]
MPNKQFMLYLLGIFVTTVILIVFLQYNSNSNINKLRHGNEALVNEFQILGETQELETDMLYIETHVYRTIFSGDSGYLEGIKNRERIARARLLKLKPFLLTDSTKALVRQLDSLIEAKLQFSNILINAFFMKGQPALKEIYKSVKAKYIMGEIVNVIDLLNKPRQQNLTKLANDANKSGRSARDWGIILAIIAALTCIFTFWYITNRLKHQQQLFDQLNESEKKVRQAGIMKENFMANMSHEIRTPMNAILGFTNLLLKESLNEKSNKFVNSIQNSGESLLAIINDILDFSKIEAGMMRIESNPFSLRGLLHSVETMFASRMQPKNLRLTVNVEKAIPDLLKGDAVRLTQIMVNLVNNSIKFTDSGEIKISVTAVNIEDDSINISFSVKDTGIGIPPDKIDTIFERFQQADQDTTRKYGGTGLGLSIVKQLVELQNGTIHVSSVQNLGTEFVFTIPYTISKELTDRVNFKILANDEIQLNERNINILVAEDNAMNQSLMKHLLDDWHLDFDIVNNGEEAIEALKQKKYSLVLMDIQMPQMDGYTATMKIRTELKNDIPVIAMTAHAMAGEREKCLSYGMNEYIPKPIRESELFKIINSILKTNRTTPGKENDNISENIGKVLDLAYLKELSHGNTKFEISMIKQFLQQLPGELEALQDAFNKKNHVEVIRIAHNMKTSVSFMGLTEKLDPYLDYIEINAGVREKNTYTREKIMEVNTICQQAILDSKEYLERIS